MAIALSEIGNEVEVITFNKSDNYYINKTELLVDNKVEFKFIGFFYRNFPNWVKFIFTLIRSVRKSEVVLLSASWQTYGLLTFLICLLFRKPYVTYPHGSYDSYIMKGFKKYIWWNIIDYFIYRCSIFSVALTESEKISLNNLGIKKVNVVPNGVSVNSPKSDFRIDDSLRGFLNNQNFILFLGRVVEKKAVLFLLDVFQNVIKVKKDIKLVIAGPWDNEYKLKLDNKINKLNLSQKVFFTGSVNGDLKWWLFENCNFFVLPSYSEGHPIAVLEAIQKNKYVVISSSSNVSIDESAGLIHPNHNLKDVTSKYLQAFNNQIKYKSTISNTKHIMSWNEVAKKTIDLIKNKC